LRVKGDSLGGVLDALGVLELEEVTLNLLGRRGRDLVAHELVGAPHHASLL
jgi:hypothetical protein